MTSKDQVEEVLTSLPDVESLRVLAQKVAEACVRTVPGLGHGAFLAEIDHLLTPAAGADEERTRAQRALVWTRLRDADQRLQKAFEANARVMNILSSVLQNEDAAVTEAWLHAMVRKVRVPLAPAEDADLGEREIYDLDRLIPVLWSGTLTAEQEETARTELGSHICNASRAILLGTAKDPDTSPRARIDRLEKRLALVERSIDSAGRNDLRSGWAIAEKKYKAARDELRRVGTKSLKLDARNIKDIPKRYDNLLFAIDEAELHLAGVEGALNRRGNRNGR
jgi:hypothetical protein